MDLRVGCSGWSYSSWVGPFYPEKTKPDKFLKLYSSVFNTVEVDSSFYSVPKGEIVSNWRDSTPSGFLFTMKFPGSITHDNSLADPEGIIPKFIEVAKILGKKLGMVLIQLPPFFEYNSGIGKLKEFLENLADNLKFAIEFRHKSWFREDVYGLLMKRSVTIVWSETPYVEIVPPITSDTIYLRLIGDRNIREDQFGQILRDRTSQIRKWADIIKRHNDDVQRVYVFSNNHFQGFAPGTVSLFSKEMGLNEIRWSELMSKTRDEGQTTLF
ncbi:DUF72 domain-containing protein [Thermoplasmatales archaeon AK]|nr:DUF72 domain-containing protein [Thermoplasmatales archaeon AK]